MSIFVKCSNCRSERVLVEAVGDGSTRRTCQACGHAEVVNSSGQRLLTDDMASRPQAPSGPRTLTEG